MGEELEERLDQILRDGHVPLDHEPDHVPRQIQEAPRRVGGFEDVQHALYEEVKAGSVSGVLVLG